MRVLVVAPHMDDEVLGAGGAIVRHIEQGDQVRVCFIAHRIYGHRFDEERNKMERKCALEAQNVLGYQESVFLDLPDERLDQCIQDIVIPVEQVQHSFDPECVYIPHRGDNNQDHRAVFQAAQIVFRPAATPSLHCLLCYEVASSTEQAPPTSENAFLPSYFVNISNQLDRKLAALTCYETEVRSFPHPRSPEGVRVQAQWRGMMAGFPAAEAFTVLRWRNP